MGLGVGGTATGKVSNLYPHLCLETVFPALKLTQVRGQKSQFFVSFMNWEKLGSILYAAQNQHFKIKILNLWMIWEKLCPNLSFTVENKMGNLHKKEWSHFKFNMND